ATSTEPIASATTTPDATTTEPAPSEPVPPTPHAPSSAPALIAERRLSQWMSRHGWSAPETHGSLPGAPTTPAGWAKADSFVFASHARNGMPSADSISTADEPSSAVEMVPLVLTEGGARDPKNPLTP